MTGTSVGEDGRRRIAAMVTFLARVGATDDLGGGVAPAVLADALPWHPSTVGEHCRILCQKGVFVEVQGRAADGRTGPGVRPSFLPADHPDVPGDETPDDPPRTLAEVRRADD